MINRLKYISPEWSPDVWNRNGSESEGLSFNLCVVLPRIVVSLILGDKDRVGDQRLEVRDDFIVKDRGRTWTMKRRIQVVEQDEDLRE